MTLEVEDLSVSYGGIGAVHGVSLTVGSGQIATVIGPNGAGKTTLLNAIMGVHPGEGSVRLAGVDLARHSVEARVRSGLCLVPEKRELFGTLSVEDNLRLGAFRFRAEGRAAARRGLAEIYALFPRLAERRLQHAGTLSGGERQMLAMGRALMARPGVLMLDEPSLGLAPLIVREVFQIIVELRSRGGSILLVEQNARAALQVADHGYVLESGRIAFAGPSAALANDPRIAQTYLGGPVSPVDKSNSETLLAIVGVMLSRSTSTSLDVLRSLAAITVVLQHANWLELDGGVFSFLTAQIGHTAVVVFFVLSGFVISATTRPGSSASDYAVKRFARIYAVTLPALLLTVALDFASLRLGSVPESAYELHKPAMYLAVQLAFSGDLWWLAINTFSDRPYWSLNYEVWYYVVFGVAMFARGWARYAGLSLVLFVMGPKLLLLLPVWVGGVAVHWLSGKWELPRGVARVMMPVAVAALLGFTWLGWDSPVAAAGKQLAELAMPIPLRYSQWFLADYVRCVFAMLLVWSLCSAEFTLPVRVERSAFEVASVSFSLYLVHFPLMRFLAGQMPEYKVLALILAVSGAVGFGLVFEPQRHRLRLLLNSTLRGMMRKAA